jgi:glucose/arabinose dehydrogenase
LLVVALLSASCAGSDDTRGEQATSTTAASTLGSTTTAQPTTTAAPSSTTTAPPVTAAPGAAVRAKLTPVATLDQPLAMAIRRNDPALYIAEKTGRVRRLVSGRVDGQPVWDLSAEVSGGGEQGLLGIAWSPDGAALYAYYTDVKGDVRIHELTPGTGARRELLVIPQPFANHNGGGMVFGRDGLLYIAVGDGGSGNDPMQNGQNLGTILGKLLRIDPRPSPGLPYTIPPDNPFVARAGARGEIFDFGLRNPFRFSFDRMNGDRWIGDVGQNSFEEIDVAPATLRGVNWGWGNLEGRQPVRGRPAPPDARGPIHVYRTSVDGTCAVSGGFVYRGQALAAQLGGRYVFADTCQGRLQVLDRQTDFTSQVASLGLQAPTIASFGEDAAGELYVLSLQGVVSRIDPAG